MEERDWRIRGRLREAALYLGVLASTFYVSSCASLEDRLRQYYGPAYWDLMITDFNLLFDNRTVTDQAMKIQQDIEEEILKKAEEKM